MPDYEELLDACKASARAGGKELLAWQGRFATREKAACDLVTDADLASQKAVFSAIQARFDDHGLLGEEKPDLAQLAHPYCWVVDPLDGTTNYVHDFPFFCVSVAVAHEGRLAAGVIFDPLREECFSAAAGHGSWLNDQPIRVSQAEQLGESLVAASLPPHAQNDSPDVQSFLQVSPQCRAIRRTGSAALNLAYVACGRLDAHWAHSVYPWDSAAGVLLVCESGGQISSSRGGRYQLAEGDYCVAATRELQQSVLSLIARA